MEKEFRYMGRYDIRRGPNGVDSGANLPVVIQNARTGSSNPRWKYGLQNGVFTASSYTRASCEAQFQSGSCGMTWRRLNNGVLQDCFTTFTGDGTLLNGLGTPSLVYSAADVSKTSATAIGRLHEKIRQQTTEMQGITLLGELNETLRMMRRPLQGTVRIMDNYARAMKRRAVDSRTRRQFLNGLTDQYLEMVFGWQPLISDAKSLAITAARAVSAPRPLKRLEARAEAPPYSSHYGALVGAADCQQRLSSVTRGELSTVAIAYMKESINGPSTSLEKFIQLSGFNLENFVPSVYNLIPFSFVADYVSNLGDIVSAASTCQINVIGYVQSTREVITRNESLSFDLASSAKNVGGFGHSQQGSIAGSVEYKRVNFSRATGGAGSVPIPTFHWDTPSAGQFTNLAALIAGFFSGIRPPRR